MNKPPGFMKINIPGSGATPLPVKMVDPRYAQSRDSTALVASLRNTESQNKDSEKSVSIDNPHRAPHFRGPFVSTQLP